jgi:hypothetical protein
MKPSNKFSRKRAEAILRAMNAVDHMPRKRGDVEYIEVHRRDDPQRHLQIARVACLGASYVIDLPFMAVVEGGDA